MKLTREEFIKHLHDVEDEYNREMSGIQQKIGALTKRKKKLAQLVSKNMKFRNYLINNKNGKSEQGYTVTKTIDNSAAQN